MADNLLSMDIFIIILVEEDCNDIKNNKGLLPALFFFFSYKNCGNGQQFSFKLINRQLNLQ